MRRSKYYSYSSFSKQKSWLRNGSILVLVSIPLILLLAEFAVRGVVAITGTTNQLDTPQNTSVAEAYRFQLLDANGKPYTGISEAGGQLQVRRSPLMGYELIPSQTSKFWQIDEHGFRNSQSVSGQKPKGEIRIFILGNSTAFGQMATSNDLTFAHTLETLLNKRLVEQNQNPGKFKPKVLPFFADQVEKIQSLPVRIREGNYRVVTAAVPGYISSNELALLVHRIMAFSPDCAIVLDGYEDLRLPSKERAAEIGNLDKLLEDPAAYHSQRFSDQIDKWISSFYLVKAWRHWVAPPRSETYRAFNADRLTNDPKELKLRIDRYRYNIKQIARLMAGLPTVVAIQPEITGKKNSLTKEESQAIEHLGKDYQNRIESAYAELNSSSLQRDMPNNVRFTNLYSLFNNFSERAFYDPIHLTDAANNKVADRLYKVLQDVFSEQPVPAEGPATREIKN